MSLDAEQLIAEFRADLSYLSCDDLFQKYVLDAQPKAISDAAQRSLRNTVCRKFDVEFTSTVLVGSSKLGFSVKPKKRYAPFGEDSDIDIAIVSKPLFENVWQQAYQYRASKAYWPKNKDFFDYLSSGWIRPDQLPTSDMFPFKKEWWDFFENLSQSEEVGGIKVRGGLYYSWFFLTEYQKQAFQKCIDEVNT